MFGMFLRRAALATLLVLLVASLGCATRRPPYADAIDRSIVHGGMSYERDGVCDGLGYLECPVRSALTDIHITDGCPHYKPRDANGNWQESAHCHTDTRKICIHRGYVYDRVVWHEAGHGLYWSRSADERAAAAISVGYYGNTEGEFPRNGILTPYGATNRYEDFAEWFEWAMCYLYHTPTGNTDVDLTRVDASDTRYVRHLRVLRDWGAINQAQYDQLEPFFTIRVDGEPLN